MKNSRRQNRRGPELTGYLVLRWQISRIYRHGEAGGHFPDNQHYLEITINPSSERNQFSKLLNSSGRTVNLINKDLFRDIGYDEIEYWLEDEKLGYIFESDLMTLIRDTVSTGQEINRRSIEEDMVFMMIGPAKEINMFYNRISTGSIENLNKLLSGKKNSRQEFQLVDITPQARKMASAIYNKALKNNTSGETKSTS